MGWVWIMFRMIWKMGSTVQRWTQKLPSNKAIARLRNSGRARWPLIAAAILVPMYVGGAVLAVRTIDGGGPGWLNLFVFCWLWSAIKFTMLAVVQPLRILLANVKPIGRKPKSVNRPNKLRNQAESGLPQ